jgi:hypothetical protein
MSELHVIVTISNPLRFRSRYKLYEEFKNRVLSDGANLYTIELALGDQSFAVTQGDCEHHFQVRSRHLIWHKENLVNVALKRLPPNWKYAAWVDADIAFVRKDWVQETLRQLEHHAFVQMFSHALYLGPVYEPLKNYEGFVFRILKERAGSHGGLKTAGLNKEYGQSGGAWAARRDALEAVGGLIDWSILGANDFYMALALVGELDPRWTRMPESNYAKMLLAWQERCRKQMRGKIGYVNNLLLHYWHGSRKDRGYGTRWQILVDHQFDPAVDLRTDAQGLLELTDGKPALRDAIRGYFSSRNEDES